MKIGLIGLCVLGLILVSARTARADIIVTVPCSAGPWNQALNPSFDYSQIYGHMYHDNTAPVTIAVATGVTLTVAYVSGAVIAGAGYPAVDANGESGNVTNNSYGFPAYYMNPAITVHSMALVATFANDGVIVGTPFLLGNGPTTVTAPAGANQLLLGINDAGYGDNSGALTVSVSVAGPANVEFVLVGKSVNYLQTSSAAPALADDTPFGFDAEVAGTDLAGIPAPSIAVPPGSGILHPFMSTTYNGGLLGYNGDADDEEWRFGAPNFNGVAAPTAAMIDRLFPNGLYTFSVLGATIPLELSSPGALGPPPAFTLTGGWWMDGKYVVHVRQPVTITSTPFLGYGANVDGLIDFSIGGEPWSHVSARSSEDPDADAIDFTIPACQLVPGQDYHGFGVFIAIVDFSTGVSGIPSSQNAAYHKLETEFVISATGTCDDTEPPVIQSLTTSAPSLWPPDHRMVPVTVEGVVTDNVSQVVTTRIISVTSNEPDNGLGDGDTPGDIEQTGPMSVNLRAERSGTGRGRVYTIVVKAADEAGNTTTAQVQVLVPSSRRK